MVCLGVVIMAAAPMAMPVTAGATDIFGVGRVVDEASEIIHEFDRPVISIYTMLKGKKGSQTRLEFHVSKLDILLFLALTAMVINMIKYASGSKSGAIYESSFPLLNNFLAIGGIKEKSGEASSAEKAAWDWWLQTMKTSPAGAAYTAAEAGYKYLTGQ